MDPCIPLPRQRISRWARERATSSLSREPDSNALQVFDDRNLFTSTLEKLLAFLGQKVKVPKIATIEVDLHTLYRSVTALGGVESVINRKMFVVACEPFNFPPSFTNKSFVIKKLYFTALYHYEQVYFRGQSGKPIHNININTQAILRSPSSHLPQVHSGSSSEKSLKRPRVEGGCESPRPTPMPKIPSSLSQKPPPHLHPGERFNGIIEYSSSSGNGYVVTITVQGQRFQAALVDRSAADSHLGNFFPSSSMLHPLQEMDSGLRLGLGGGGGGPSEQRKPRGLTPAPVRTAFSLFFESVNKEQLLATMDLSEGSVNPANMTDEEIYRLAQEVWGSMGPETKVMFEDLAEKDQQRYDEEVRESQSSFLVTETPSSYRSAPRVNHGAHLNPVMNLPIPYPAFLDPSLPSFSSMPSPFGLPPSCRRNLDCGDNAGPRVSNNSGAMGGGGGTSNDDEDSRSLEAVLELGGPIAQDEDMEDLAMALRLKSDGMDLKDHIDIFGGVAQVAARPTGQGGASKASSLLLGDDKSPMAEGISSACTTATREKALV